MGLGSSAVACHAGFCLGIFTGALPLPDAAASTLPRLAPSLQRGLHWDVVPLEGPSLMFKDSDPATALLSPLPPLPYSDGPVSPPADKSITMDPLASLWLFICPVYPAHYDMRSLKAGFSFLVQHLISSTKDSSFNRQYVLDSW